MNYNTDRVHITMREYGRHIQYLIEYAITIEEKEKRQKTAEAIISLMAILNPQVKSMVDYRQKLWDHLFIMSNFKLDVESPFPIPSEEEVRIKPADLPYPKNTIRYKHYGKNVESMVKKASTMEDDAKKQAFTEIIGNFMKLAYKNWSNEEVNNELVKNDIKAMSNGLLEISDDMDIETMTKLQRKNSYPNSNNNNNNRNRNNKNRNNKNRNNNNNNNRRFK
jgi:hypothetical protein